MCGNFYPRPPRGGRLSFSRSSARQRKFLSTPSARRATAATKDRIDVLTISIHALREEGDGGISADDPNAIEFLSTPSARRATTFPAAGRAAACYFYPRPPRGGRPGRPAIIVSNNQFLSTPSARRATRQVLGDGRRVQISIHALREEGDVLDPNKAAHTAEFLSTPSARRATPRRWLQMPRRTFLSTPSARRATYAKDIRNVL